MYAVQQPDLQQHKYVTSSLHRNKPDPLPTASAGAATSTSTTNAVGAATAATTVHPNNLFFRVGRQRSSSRRRMGMVILTPDSPAEGNFFDRQLVCANSLVHQSLSIFPSTAAYDPPTDDSRDTRIYDRVADESFTDEQKMHEIKDRSDSSDYEHHDEQKNFLSSKINIGDIISCGDSHSRTESINGCMGAAKANRCVFGREFGAEISCLKSHVVIK